MGSTSGRGRVAIKWTDADYLLKGNPSKYITKTKVNSAFHPSGVDKSSTGLSGRG